MTTIFEYASKRTSLNGCPLNSITDFRSRTGFSLYSPDLDHARHPSTRPTENSIMILPFDGLEAFKDTCDWRNVWLVRLMHEGRMVIMDT
jgi:hypothetical protein